MQAFRNLAKPLIFVVTISFFAWLVLDLSGLPGGPGGSSPRRPWAKSTAALIDTRVFQQAVSQATEERQTAIT
jgi:hypothetical protein